MRHFLTAIVLAIEAAAIAVASLAVIAVPTVLMWIVSFSLGAEPATIAGIIAAVWGLSHGVPLLIEFDPQTALNFGLGTDGITFTLSLIPLGVTLITFWLAGRMGSRFRVDALGGAIALFSGTLGFGAAAYLILSIVQEHIQWSIWASAMVATLWFAVPAWAVYFSHHSGLLSRGWHRAAAQLKKAGAPFFSTNVSHLIPRTLRLSLVLGATLTALAAIAFAVTLVASYPEVIRLSQELQLDYVGVGVLFIMQLAFLPTFIIWTLSWLSGAGFAIGAGSTITSFEVLLGPLPALPVFGAIPEAWNDWGFLSVLLVAVVAIAVGITFGGLPEYRNPKPLTIAGIAISATVIMSAGAALLAVFSSGSIGPGRMSEAGPPIWMFAAWIGAETFIGLTIGLMVRRLPAPSQYLTRQQRDVSDGSQVAGHRSKTRAVDTPVRTGTEVYTNLDQGFSHEEDYLLTEPLEELKVPDSARESDESEATRSVATEGTEPHEEPVRTSEAETSRIADPNIERQQSWFRRPIRKAKPKPDFTEEALLEEYSWEQNVETKPDSNTEH